LDRSRKPIEVTETGALFVAKGKELKSLVTDLTTVLEGERENLSGKLTLGIIPTLSQYLLPLFLKPFLEEHPGLHIEVHEMTSEPLLAGLRQHRIDLALLALPAAGPGLAERPLFTEEFVAYFPPGYWPPEAPPARLPLSELHREQMLLLAEGHCLRHQVLSLCHHPSQPTTNRLEFETGSLESLKAMVDQGLGYTLLPELASMNLDAERQDQVRFLSEPCPSRRVGFVHRQGFPRLRLMRLLEAAIRAGLPAKVRRNEEGFVVPWK
jgi:LysR family hydrogen peroxide-inducible transcriptional activator